MLTRQVRQLTAELRILLHATWWTQAQLAAALQVSQRTVNSRLQTLSRAGELLKKNRGYGTTAYKLSAKGAAQLAAWKAMFSPFEDGE